MSEPRKAPSFDPQDHLMRIQGKDYLPVKWRIVWFHDVTTSRAGYITVELEHNKEKVWAKFFCIAWDGNDEHWRTIRMNGIEIDVCGRVATGEALVTQAQFPSYYEKAATKAVGRAMGGLNLGTEFATELDDGEEEGDIADAPVERKSLRPQPQPKVAPQAKVTVAPRTLPNKAVEAIREHKLPERISALAQRMDRADLRTEIANILGSSYADWEQHPTVEGANHLNAVLIRLERKVETTTSTQSA